ncbi:MAG: hypothetical protein IJ232_01845 [Lachnospiraceae bacterium]|nr:hypothetical protein [Lachnospiraceae bacterium]
MKDCFCFKYFNEFINPDVHKKLKYTSEDDSKKPSEYMTQIKTKVIDFDEVKKNYLKEHGMDEGNAKSVDALYKLDNRLCMTEFKNGDFNSNEIIEKALSSAMIYMDITGCRLDEFRKNSVFVLVYNGEEKRINSRQKAARYKAKSSNRKYSSFQLDHLWNFCFEEVVEIEKDDFDDSKYAKEIVGY